MIKKIISLLIIFTMVLTIAIPTNVFSAESGDEVNSIYTDIADHWAKTEIERWSNFGLIQGNEGLFRPASSITRGEMAVIIDRLMKYQVKASNSFNDLSTTWYTDAILGANYAGIILGSNGQVRPNDLITREEAVVMLGRALHINESNISAGFSDMSNVSSWAEGYVNALTSRKIINGVGNNVFEPKSNITRAEVVKILDNAIKGFFNNAGTYTTDVDGDVIINTSGVTLKNMEIAGNLIIAEGVGEGEVNIDNVKIKGNITVKGGGENSIYFNNVTVEGALIVNKIDGNLRIVATGSTSVSVATLESGIILVTRNIIGGGIEKIEIPASVAAGQNIVLQGNFNTVVNNASGIKIETNGKINNLVLNEKTTISGNAVITSITTAEGADSIINGKNISGGQTRINLADDKKYSSNDNSNSSGDNGNSNTPVPVTGITLNKSNVTLKIGTTETLVATVLPTNATTKSAIWTTSNPAVATVNKGVVNAISTGSAIISVTTIDGNKSASCLVTVIEETESGWQPPEGVDSRFAQDYPKVSINNENKIEFRVKLISPGEVFMIVNQYNSHVEPSVNSIIHGHTGNDDNEPTESDGAAYINITDTNEHVITTDVILDGHNNIKVYFVIKDASKTSDVPTIVEFTADVVDELDNISPRFYNAFINSTKDKIMLYFNEKLDDTVSIENSEFSLNIGNVLSSTVYNYNYGYRSVGKVELTVSEINNIDGLKISYNGTSLRDTAIAKNKVERINNAAVYDGEVSILPEKVYVSNNGEYININVEKSLFFEPKPERDRYKLTLKYGPDQESATKLPEGDYELRSLYSNSGSSMQISIKIDNIPELKTGDKYFIEIDPNGLKNYAGDTAHTISVECVPSEIKEAEVIPLSAVYDLDNKTITIKFPPESGLSDGSTFGCFFKLTFGGEEYILRDITWFDGDTLVLEPTSFPFDPSTFNWSEAKISYSLEVHPEASVHSCLTFKSGMPYEGFTNIKVEPK